LGKKEGKYITIKGRRGRSGRGVTQVKE